MVQTSTTLEAEVRDAIRRDGVDPVADRARVTALVARAIDDYEERAIAAGLPPLEDVDLTAKRIVDEVAGFGPLQPYFDDPLVEEIWINEPGKVFVARDGVSELTPTILTADGVRDLVERMLKSSGRRVDLSSPFVDASLPDGSRLHVVIPDVSREHWQVNVRRFVAKATHLDDLVRLGTLTRHAADFLAAAVASGEEVFELQLPLRDVAAMQCRQSSLEGTGEIPLRRLVKEALRMRPSRIVVGEVRQAESLDLLIALNSGLPGMATIHANSAREAITKMCTLPLLAGENVGSRFVVPTVAGSIDVVVQVALERDGTRRVREIVAVPGRVEDDVIEVADLFTRRGDELVRSDGFPPHLDRFERAGHDVTAILGAPRS